jgi:predicted metal-dependent HD superfamily phosphohydrolase
MEAPQSLRELLWRKWCDLLRPFDPPPAVSPRVFSDLADAYSDNVRHYHTLRHLLEVLETISEFRGFDALSVVELAAWFHDVVYDARSADNEARSADWAGGALPSLSVPAAMIERVKELVLLTASHEAPNGDMAAAILLDADLAILGAPPPRYREYASAIRREYAWVQEADYRAGRTRVLEKFYRRERIYHTDQLFARCEAQARRNLMAEIASLSNTA